MRRSGGLGVGNGANSLLTGVAFPGSMWQAYLLCVLGGRQQ